MSHHTAMLRELRRAGYRLTPQREMILSVICENQGHLTAEDVLWRVRAHYPYLNKSAVYRTLDLLCQLGFVNPTDFGGGRIEYEIHQHPHHHHLVCRECGKRIEVDEHIFGSLQKTLRTEYGFIGDLDHFAIFGTCQKCQKATEKESHAHP